MLATGLRHRLNLIVMMSCIVNKTARRYEERQYGDWNRNLLRAPSQNCGRTEKRKKQQGNTQMHEEVAPVKIVALESEAKLHQPEKNGARKMDDTTTRQAKKRQFDRLGLYLVLKHINWLTDSNSAKASYSIKHPALPPAATHDIRLHCLQLWLSLNQ